MNFIRLFILCSLLLASAHAARVATVTGPKAVIYADADMKSPIGYVRHGKKLLVGEVSRSRGTILPVVIHGKVAWVQVSDISIEDGGPDTQQKKARITEHELEEIYNKEDEDPWTLNNYLIAGINSFNPSTASLSAHDAAGDDLSQVESSSYSIYLEHRQPFYNYALQIGLETYEVSTASISYKTWALGANYVWRPLKLGLVSIEALGGVLLSGDFRVASQGVGESGSQMYGYQVAAQARLFPTKKFGGVIGVGFKKMIVTGLKKIANQNNDNEVDVNGLSGVALYAGLTYRF